MTQGISFLDAMYLIFLQRQVNKEFMDSEIHNWLQLFLQLVDITGDSPEVHLSLFISGDQPVIKEYCRPFLKEKVSSLFSGAAFVVVVLFVTPCT